MRPPTSLDTPCREYPGTRSHQGYGLRQGAAAKRWGTKYVHRQIWVMVHGPIPAGQMVLHRCDNPPCFRYDHLFLGTRQENSADMKAKGRKRGIGGRPRPEFCPKGHRKADVHGRWICPECKRAADRLAYQTRRRT